LFKPESQKLGLVVKQVSLVVVAVLLGLIALTPFLHFESIFSWEVTILSTEFGNWLAVFCLLILGLSFYCVPSLKRAGGLVKAFSILLLFVSAAVFLAPFLRVNDVTVQALENLQQKFPLQSEKYRLMSPSLLHSFYFSRESRVVPKTFEFAPGLLLDYYAAVGVKNSPWVVVVHGGGWDSGDRKQLPELNEYLANHGISVIAVSYHLAPKSHWPVPRQDVQSAVQFVSSHAAEWDLDSSRYVIMGRSAGGQIAESVAYNSSDPALKGCIALYAPADLEFAYQFGSESDVLNSPLLLRNYMGTDSENLHSALKQASPIFDVSAHSPPTLLFHGDRDTLVWEAQSRRLKEKLDLNGVPAVFVELPWATHGFDYTLHGPGGQISTAVIERFLAGVFQK
jgi:acetyl esterase/lipase